MRHLSRRAVLLLLPILVAACSASCGGDDAGAVAPSAGDEVVVNARPLGADQIDALEQAYGVRAIPGSYWYDPMSGLFGQMGSPSQGLLRPGHDFGPLPADASNGTSGVFLNGRQLTLPEVQYLSYFTGAIAPGRYWMDGMSNVGYENNPTPILNLYLLMAQFARAGGGPVGGDNVWSSMYGSGNYTPGNSSGYVHIPSTTGGSGTFVSY